MKLPELSPTAAPEFVDAAECKAWIEHVPLANVAAAQQQILRQLEELNRFPTSPANRMAILEALREPVNFVQIEQAKRFTNRALPMAAAESAVFDDTDALWEQMSVGYLRCMESALDGGTAPGAQAALVSQRALAYSGLKMFHHYRAYRQVPARDWRGLHEVYAAAERLQVAEEPVKDVLNRDVHDTSPRIAYARAVLMGMCNPNELSQRQLTFVAFLLERWAAKLEVSPRPVDEGDDIAPLIADLASDHAPQRGETPGAAAPAERYLDTRKLAKSLRNRVGLLRKGESPAKLALGEDCVQPSCEQMLVFLFRQWCQGKPARSGERRRVGAPAKVCNELEVIHYHVGGQVFRQPGQQTELTQKQREEIATFGRISTRDQDDYSDVHGFALEAWQLEDDSAQGMRLVRAADAAGKRYAHGQLVGVLPGDSKRFMLGQVRWLMSAANGDLHAGIKLLPGIPAAASVRSTGLNVQNESYVQALALDAMPGLDAPASLILPVGWFKPKRVLDAFVDTALRVRLTEVIERGIDFERVAYETLTA